MHDVRQLAVSASLRAAATLYLELKCGIDSLATIADSGSLLGLFLAVSKFTNSFHGGSGPKSAHFARLFLNLTEVWLPIACGLGLSLFAHIAHRTLSNQLSCLREEAGRAAVEFAYLLPQAKVANFPRFHP